MIRSRIRTSRASPTRERSGKPCWTRPGRRWQPSPPRRPRPNETTTTSINGSLARGATPLWAANWSRLPTITTPQCHACKSPKNWKPWPRNTNRSRQNSSASGLRRTATTMASRNWSAASATPLSRAAKKPKRCGLNCPPAAGSLHADLSAAIPLPADTNPLFGHWLVGVRQPLTAQFSAKPSTDYRVFIGLSEAYWDKAAQRIMDLEVGGKIVATVDAFQRAKGTPSGYLLQAADRCARPARRARLSAPRLAGSKSGGVRHPAVPGRRRGGCGRGHPPAWSRAFGSVAGQRRGFPR